MATNVTEETASNNLIDRCPARGRSCVHTSQPTFYMPMVSTVPPASSTQSLMK